MTIDGQTYKTVTIGSQTWLAENLNLNVSNSYCYNDLNLNCNVYGCLYTWEAAKAAAAKVPGWHLPTDEEWMELEMSLGMTLIEVQEDGWRGSDEGTKLKEDGSSGMNLLLAGSRNSIGSFSYLGYGGYFWSASPNGSSYAWYRYVDSRNSNVYRSYTRWSGGFSVQLVVGTQNFACLRAGKMG